MQLFKRLMEILYLGMEIVRSYTVVPPTLESSNHAEVTAGRQLNLMVKIYPDGALTPLIGRLKEGRFFSTPVLKHGGLICIAFCLSVRLSVRHWTKIRTRK